MKAALLILIPLVWACDHPVNNPPNAKATPALATLSPQEQKTDSVPSYALPASNTKWRDRLTGSRYPVPDSIGGKPAGFYLKSPKVSPLAKALYTARFRPSDTDSTAQLLALVTTDDSEIRPFYRWCLDFTIGISDGALSEYPGEPALAYATKFPKEFFAYMDKDSTGERYQRWVEIIRYSGLPSYNEGTSAVEQRISKQMSRACTDCNADISKRIAGFARDVAKVFQAATQ